MTIAGRATDSRINVPMRGFLDDHRGYRPPGESVLTEGRRVVPHRPARNNIQAVGLAVGLLVALVVLTATVGPASPMDATSAAGNAIPCGRSAERRADTGLVPHTGYQVNRLVSHAPGSPARGHRRVAPTAIGYDAERNVIVLDGGVSADGANMDDTWEWDGSCTASMGAREATGVAIHGIRAPNNCGARDDGR